MLFPKMSEASEDRLMTVAGMVLSLCLVVATTIFAIGNPFGRKPTDRFSIVIETPYVGQGVEPGTALVMHGVEVGQVNSVSSLPGGGVRLGAELQRRPTAGLTDTAGIDFRPANYFGVTGINLQSGKGGRALAEGSLISAKPLGNFTLQTLLSRLGEISNGVLTPQLIRVVESATTYIDGLEPLLETMVVVANSLKNTQTVSTERLLTNSTGISLAFPGFVNAVINVGDHYTHAAMDDVSEDFFQSTWRRALELAAGSFFGAIGKLEGQNSVSLAPLTDMLKVLTDSVPGLVPSDALADTARELRLRLDRLFSGPPERRAVNVRVVLDSLPGIAAPINAVGGAP